MTALRAEAPLPAGLFTPAHYPRVHHHLFQDVYRWAGRYRTVRTAMLRRERLRSRNRILGRHSQLMRHPWDRRVTRSARTRIVRRTRLARRTGKTRARQSQGQRTFASADVWLIRGRRESVDGLAAHVWVLVELACLVQREARQTGLDPAPHFGLRKSQPLKEA